MEKEKTPWLILVAVDVAVGVLLLAGALILVVLLLVGVRHAVQLADQPPAERSASSSSNSQRDFLLREWVLRNR